MVMLAGKKVKFVQLGDKPQAVNTIITRVPTYLPEDLLLSASPNLLKVTRMTKWSPTIQEVVATTTVKILWSGKSIPKKITLGFLGVFYTKPFNPPINQCFRYLRFGHVAITCKAVCQVQAVRREPHDRALPPEEGGKSGGCNKVCELSRPKAAKPAPLKEADFPPLTTRTTVQQAEKTEAEALQTSQSNISPQHQESGSNQGAHFGAAYTEATRGSYERFGTFYRSKSAIKNTKKLRESEIGSGEEGAGEAGSPVNSHCDSPSSSSSEPFSREFLFQEENCFPQRLDVEANSCKGGLGGKSNKGPCHYGSNSSCSPRSGGSGGSEGVSCSTSNPSRGSPRNGNGESPNLPINRNSSGTGQHHQVDHPSFEGAAENSSAANGHCSGGSQNNATSGQNLLHNTVEPRFSAGGAALQLLSWNACSLKSKLPALTQVALSNNLDIICIQESFMTSKPNGQPPLKIPGYATFFLPKILGRTRGLITFVKSSIPSEKVYFISDVGKATEVLAIKIYLDWRPFLLFNIHRRRAQHKFFLSPFLQHQFKSILLGGCSCPPP